MVMTNKIFEMILNEAKEGPTENLRFNFLLIMYDLVDLTDAYLLSVGESRFIFKRDELRNP